MKVSREQAAENRDRMIGVAARLFRERGFDGIGVSDLMKEAGLTHGAFYGNFAAKEDLMAAACTNAIDATLTSWSGFTAAAPDAPFEAVAARYLSRAHVENPGLGCVAAALGADIARHGDAVKRAATAGISAQIDFLAGVLPGKSQAIRHEKAIAAFASMVGAMLLARSVDDPLLAEEILQATASALPGPARRREATDAALKP